MPTNQLPFTPAITMVFKGFIIMRVTDGAPSAKIGALKDSLCHQPRITINKLTPRGRREPFAHGLPDSLDKNFHLSAENVPAANAGITIFNKNAVPFNRLDEESDDRDFRWVIDFEEFFGKPITIDESKLQPIFEIDNGIIYTSRVSPGEVKVRRPDINEPVRFGRYGLDIGVNVYFHSPNGKITLKYGDNTIFEATAAANDRFEVEVNCNCETDITESDFPLIFQVIGASLSDDDKRIDLVGDPIRRGGVHTPEVYCTGGKGN